MVHPSPTPDDRPVLSFWFDEDQWSDDDMLSGLISVLSLACILADKTPAEFSLIATIHQHGKEIPPDVVEAISDYELSFVKLETIP